MTRLVAAAVAVLIAVGLVAVASLPTGAATAAGVAPAGARVAGAVELEDATVLLLSEGGRLRVQVAYRGPKGWLGALLPPAPDGVVAAWTGTDGAGPVPALSALYGTAPGDAVRVRWSDGETAEVDTAIDGTWLVARPGAFRSTAVEVLRDGRVEQEVPGP